MRQLSAAEAKGSRSGEDEVVRLRFSRQRFIDHNRACIRVAGFQYHAEADKGVHLVQVAADLRFKALQLRYVGIDRYLEEIAIALKPIEDPVEQIPTLRIAMDGGELRSFEEGL